MIECQKSLSLQGRPMRGKSRGVDSPSMSRREAESAENGTLNRQQAAEGLFDVRSCCAV